MRRAVKEKATSSATDWATLRPRVTGELLADITRRVVDEFQPHKVVLFGSYAYGEPDLDSDVDLLVVMESTESMAQRIIRVAEVAQVRFLPMDILVYTPGELGERLSKGDFFIAEILQKGRVLYERDAGG
jgi:predicted nucleotidyltransferase